VEFVQKALQLPELKYAVSTDDDTVVTSYGIVTAGKYGVSSAAHDVLKIGPGPNGFVSNFAYEISKHRCWERETDGLAVKVAF
jgi:catalase